MSIGGQRIVVLGAGFGGLSAALRIAKARPSFEVLLIDEHGRHVYKPWLYEIVSGCLHGASQKEKKDLRDTTSFPIRDIIRANKLNNIRFLQKTVQGVDFTDHHVLFSDGKTARFDKIVLAIGSIQSLMSIPGVEKYARLMSSIDSAMTIREELDKALAQDHPTCDIAIIGAGATGTESAAEMANYFHDHPTDKEVHVRLIDASPRILSRFPLIISRSAQKRLERLGVVVWTDTILHEAQKGRLILGPRPPGEHEVAPDSPIHEKTRVKCDILIWAGGVKPNPLLAAFALPKDEKGLVKVLPTMQVEGHPDVFAIGDIISYKDSKTNQVAPGAAWAAIGEANVAARNIARNGKKAYHLPSKFPVIVTVGGKFATLSLWGIPLTGRLAFVIRRFVDLNYFRRIFPLSFALRHWIRSVRFLARND